MSDADTRMNHSAIANHHIVLDNGSGSDGNLKGIKDCTGRNNGSDMNARGEIARGRPEMPDNGGECQGRVGNADKSLTIKRLGKVMCNEHCAGLRGLQSSEIASIAKECNLTSHSISDRIETRHYAIGFSLYEFTADEFGKALVGDVGAHVED